MPARSVAAVLAAHPTIGDWFDLAPNGHLTAHSGKVEYGQGIRTALAQIVAHELGLPMDAVTVAPVDTRRSPDEGVTSGSRSIEESNEGLRVAAAELRHALRLAAARDLDVVLDEVQLVDGALTTSAGARIEIGRYAGSDLFSHPIDGSVRLRPVASGSVIGSSVPRSDLPAKVLGRPAFLQDIDLPHMLHCRVVRPPGVNASLVSVDEDALSGMPGGILTIVRDGSFLGVVAEREEVAIRGLARLRRVSRWEDGDPLPSSPAFMLDEPTLDVVVHQRGSDSPSDRPTTTLDAQYVRPYVAHASLGPSCAIATFDGTGYEVWSHSQGVYHLRQELAKALRTRPDVIRVRHAEGAGCYGANGADDVALDAALLARAHPGRPVRVQWMREDEFAWEPFGTAMFVKLSASLDGDGNVVRWTHEVWGNGHRDRAGADAPSSVTNLLAARHLADPLVASVAPAPPKPGSGGGRNAAPPYSFPSQLIVNHYVPRTPLRASALRSLGAHANVFAAESFMDEIGASIGADPVAHRLRYLEDPRGRRAIERVAEMAGWERRASLGDGRGLGIGYARYKGAGCYVAVVAEVVIDRDLELSRIWAAVDAGLVINPDGLLNQAEGGITQAASWTLMEEVGFDAQRVTTRDWSTYPVLDFTHAAELEVELLTSPTEDPVGVGEAFAGPTAAAIGNAIFDATGVRLRQMPLTRDRLARALA